MIDMINDFLDRLPVSRGFLLVLLVIGLCVYKFNQPFVEHERSVARFQDAIEQRQRSVRASIDQLMISDPGLLDCIREAAADRAGIHPMSTGGIDDVRELQMLYCRGSGIYSLAGIGQLPNLRYLDISSNSIQTLDPLRRHAQLKSLHVYENPLRNIDAVKTLKSLEELYLPDMPETPCRTVDGVVGKLKGNGNTIRCAGERDTASQRIAGSSSERQSKSTRNSSSGTLSAAEQQELLDYERKMRYGD